MTNISTKKVKLIKKNRKYFEAILYSTYKSYKCKIEIDENSENLELDKELNLNLEDISKKTKYGSSLTFRMPDQKNEETEQEIFEELRKQQKEKETLYRKISDQTNRRREIKIECVQNRDNNKNYIKEVEELNNAYCEIREKYFAKRDELNYTRRKFKTKEFKDLIAKYKNNEVDFCFNEIVYINPEDPENDVKYRRDTLTIRDILSLSSEEVKQVWDKAYKFLDEVDLREEKALEELNREYKELDSKNGEYSIQKTKLNAKYLEEQTIKFKDELNEIEKNLNKLEEEKRQLEEEHKKSLERIIASRKIENKELKRLTEKFKQSLFA